MLRVTSVWTSFPALSSVGYFNFPSFFLNNFYSPQPTSINEMASTIRHNFHEECEAAVNKQINQELYNSYVYMSMGYYFDRHDVALPGLSKFFKESSEEEREHAHKFMKYQNKRGGRIVLQSIAAPSQQEWGNAHDALQAALDLEKKATQSLLQLQATASKMNDPHLSMLIEDDYLEEQVESMKKLGDLITKLKRAGTSGIGEYLFDKELQ